MIKLKEIEYIILGIFFWIFPLIVYSQAATVLYGTVKNFHSDERELTLLIKNRSEETFYISHLAKFYYKNYKSPESYDFLKSNLIWGAKVKVIEINDKLKEIFIMEIPQ